MIPTKLSPPPPLFPRAMAWGTLFGFLTLTVLSVAGD